MTKFSKQSQAIESRGILKQPATNYVQLVETRNLIFETYYTAFQDGISAYIFFPPAKITLH